MTYRTLNTDTTFTQNGAPASTAVRRLRARRRTSTLYRRTSGVTLTGFGI